MALVVSIRTGYEGTLGGVKIFELVLSPEEMQVVRGAPACDKEGAEEGLAAPGSPVGRIPRALEWQAVAVSPPPASGAEPKVTSARPCPLPRPVFYPLTYNGTNAGTYGPAAQGRATDVFLLHKERRSPGRQGQCLMIDGGLEGRNFTLGSTFAGYGQPGPPEFVSADLRVQGRPCESIRPAQGPLGDHWG